MSSQFYSLSIANPHRVPNWRWQMANYLNDHGLTLGRSRGDRHVSRAKRFALEMNSAADDWQRLVVAERQPAIHQAWYAYQLVGGLKSVRWELEARLLAAEPTDDIARKTGLMPEASIEYEQIFFDVQGRLQNTSYITQVVIGDAAKRGGISERESEILWKLFGYFAGPTMLDCLIYRSTQSTKPDSVSSIGSFLTDDIRGTLQLKSAIAMRTMQVNPQTQAEIMNLYLRMVELEKQIGDGDGGQESLKAGIQSILENLPWTRSAAEAKARGLVDDLEAGGVGLRADELMLIGAGQRPEGLKELMESAVYPPRTKRTTVSQ